MKSFMNKLNALFDKKWFRIVLLAVIIAAELSYTIYLFANEKHGQHSDEVWSYAIANDSKNFEFDGDEMINRWITPDVIRDYMTVQPEERFHFGIPYHNAERDLNPPLYYMLIHFICSLFPNQYSPWYAFSLNIIALIGTQIYLFLLSEVSFKDKRYMPFVVCIFYAICRGSAATYVFMRMYAMMTTLTVANLYYQIRVLKHEGKGLWKPVLGSFITCYLGFMTHSIFPVIGGIATFMVCLWFLCHKQIKRCFCYGFAMLGSLALYAITFFAGVSHVVNTGEASQTAGATYPFRSQFFTVLSHMTEPIVNYGFSIFEGYTHIYLTVALICILALCIPLCFLFRNEEWFRRFTSAVKKWGQDFFRDKKFWIVFDYPFVLLAAVWLSYAVVCAKVVNVVMMGDSGARYVFCTYPVICLLFAMALDFVVKKIKFVKRVAVPLSLILTSVLALSTNIFPNVFLYNYAIAEDKYHDPYDLFRGETAEIYLISDWLTVPYMPYVLGCDRIRFINEEALLNEKGHGIDTSETSDGSFLLLLLTTDPDLTVSVNVEQDETSAQMGKATMFGGEIVMDRDVRETAVNEKKLREIYDELLQREDVHHIEYVCDMFTQLYIVSVYRVS
ncbi:MAG: hypothetical protein IJ149_10060 [Oscillospiraceae bacterium]|nr:hypothetical protein [Oscillospiraceae bacterium]